MKNSKGGSKNFARYLDFEYYDSYLEPLDSKVSNINKVTGHSCFNDPIEKPVQQENATTAEENTIPKKNKGFKIPSNMRKIHLIDSLTKVYLKQATEILGSDAQNCYTGLCGFICLTKGEPYDQYRSIYEKVETVPMVFLSISYSEKNSREIKAVYLWQINRKTPYMVSEEREDFTVTDIKSRKTRTHSCPSMLLLAKIVPEDGETIIDARIVGESKLLVRSVNKDSCEAILRLYSVEILYHSMRINPYRYKIIANENYSFIVRISLKRSEENLQLIANLWKRSSLEEMDLINISKSEPNTQSNEEVTHTVRFVHSEALISTHTLTLLTNEDIDMRDFFSIMICPVNEWILLMNNQNSTLLLWNQEVFQALKVNGSIHSVKELNGCYYILDQCGQFHELALDRKGNWALSMIKYKLDFPIASDFEFQMVELYDEVTAKKVNHIVYFQKNKFYSISIEENAPTIKILLDIESKVEEDQNIPWKIYSISSKVEDPNTVIIALYFEGYVHFYDIMTTRCNSMRVFRHDKSEENNWQLTTTCNGMLYLHDLYVRNRMVSINHGIDKETLLTKDFSVDVHYTYFTKTDGQAREGYGMQVGGLKDSIMLIPRENEPYYEDKLNKMYPLQQSLKVMAMDKRTKSVEEKKIEVGDEDKEVVMIEKLWKSKREMAYSKDKELVWEESDKALLTMRKSISGAMQKIWKYNQEMKEYNNDKNAYKRYWGTMQMPKEVKDVDKESLILYEQFKQEKKRIRKQNEKEKNKSKKEHGKISFF